MPDGSVPLFLVLICLLVLSGFFSGVETAFTSANRLKLRTLATGGNKKAGKVLTLAEDNYDKFITTVLVGNNIVNLTASTICALLFAKLVLNDSAPIISTAVITVAVLIFGEIIPKFIAKVYPEKIACAFYPIVIFFYYLFYPFNFIFSGLKWLISKIFRLKADDVITEDEIMTVVEEAEEDGTLKKEETKLIRSVIEFDDEEVGDILVPRVNIVAVSVDASLQEVKKVFEKEGYSRIPVYKDGIDTIIGIVHEKDFFNSYFDDAKKIEDIMQPAVFTTEHAKISSLLKTLQKKRVHMAVVLDEYGGTLGIVTLEDILEELVGEIYDEHDEEVEYIKILDDDTCLFDGNTPLNEFMEYFGLDDEEENFDANTVGGWITEVLGEIPHANKKLNYKNLEITILKSTVKRVLQIKVVNKTPEKE